MNKPILAAAGAVAVALLATPWLVGALAQQRVDAGIARLDAENDIEASVVAYSRGWMTSTATIELATPDAIAADADTPPEIDALIAQLAGAPARLIVTVRHGPLLLGDGLTLGIAASTIHLDPTLPQYSEFLEETGLAHLFEIRTVTGFDGQSEFVAEMPSFSLRNDDVTIAFSGADATGTYDAAARRLQARGRANDLRATANDGTFAMEGLVFDSDSTWRSPLMRTGFAEASVGRVEVESPIEQFVLENIAARFDIDLEDDGEHATLSSVYTLGRFSDGAATSLDDVAVTATARRVNVDALTAYYEASQQTLMQNDAAAPLSLGAEDALYDLLVSAPEIELAPVRLAWNGEPLDATVRISVAADNLPPRTNFTLLVLAFQGVVSVDATLAVSEALAGALATHGMAFQIRRAAAEAGQYMTDDEVQTIAAAQASIALAGLVAQGMLTSTVEGYETTARFANGALTVNGNAIPLGLR